MELEKLFGLPAHPLLVHLPVVMIPIVGIGAIACVIRPKWLDKYGWLLLLGSFLGMVGAILAAGSGEALEESVDRSPALEDHAELGETARNVSIVFFLVVLAVVLGRWWARRRAAEGADDGLSRFVRSTAGLVVAGVLLVGSAAVSSYAIVKAGHQGADVTWSELQEDEKGEQGGTGGDQNEQNEQNEQGEQGEGGG